jgi:dimethylargininase
MTQRHPPEAVNLALALDQHRAYVAALRDCGVEVTELAADDEHPDAVFVQDPVLVVDGRAIVLPSAVPSRCGEAPALAAALRPHVPVVALQPPATLDGGDVLIDDPTLYVGISARSNEEGCRQLADLTGRRVERVPLPAGLLHLLSGCTRLGPGSLLAVRPLAPAFPGHGLVIVPDDEAAAANVVILGRHAVAPAGYPKVAGLLERRGLAVHAVPCSEFEKRDGGVTCRALMF